MSQIHIIVGSVMGTALGVAQFAEYFFQKAGFQTQLNEQFSPGDLQDAANQLTLICTSNTGMGDLPANIAPLLPHIQSGEANVYQCRYAIINLGDSSYPNFAQAGRSLDEALQDLGAQAICPMLTIDAIYDDDAIASATPWLQELVKTL